MAGGVDWLVVNETEAAAVLRRKVEGLTDAAQAAAELVAAGVKHAVVTAGAHGAALARGPESAPVTIEAFRVEAVDTVRAGDRRPLRSHYGFRPDWCEAADPQSKGIVENLVGYAKRDLVVPQAPFAGLAAANAAARQWCAEVNAVAHSEICAVPAERLEAERDLLSGCRRCGRRSAGPA